MITPESHVRIVVRPYASALPLGFFSFAIGMLLLAGTGNGWLPVSDQHTVGILLAAFVFPLETIAAVVAFAARDTFGATGLGLFSSSWLTLGLTDLAARPGELSRAVGLYDLGFAFMIAALAIAAMLGKPLIGTILLVAGSRAALAGAYDFGARQETTLPLFRRGASKESIEGDLTDQLRGIAREAGVRQAL